VAESDEQGNGADHRIARYGKATAKPGKGDELGEILTRAADLNSGIEGCLQYDVYQSAFDPETVWVTERWADQAAIDRSLSDPRVRALIDEARPLIEDMEVIALVPLGGIADRFRQAEEREARAGELVLPAAETDPPWAIARLDEIEDVAPAHGFTGHEARFPAEAVGATQTGFAHIRVKPGERLPFGHDHADVEETYFVISGAGRFRIGPDLVEVHAGDLVRISPAVMHSVEAGPDGLEYLAFGPPQDPASAGRFEPDWWQN